MKNKTLNSLFLAFSVLFLCSSMAYGATNQYIYDELGRLAGVVDSQGNSAVYQYDSVGRTNGDRFIITRRGVLIAPIEVLSSRVVGSGAPGRPRILEK